MGRPSNAAHRRQQIVEAFIDEVAVHGYQGTSMTRLGRAAGLRPSLMHYYFATKQDMLLACLPVLEAAFSARRDAMASPRRSARARLDGLIDAHLALDASSNPHHVTAWIQLLALAHLDRDVGRAAGAILRARHAELVAALRALGHRRELVMKATGVLAAIVGMFQLASLCPELITRGGAAALVKQQVATLIEEGARARVAV